jgi:uncharacterized protein YkwD
MRRFPIWYLVFALAFMTNCDALESTNDDDGNDDQTNDRADDGREADMLAAINQLRSEGCDCGAETMPPVPALAWNEKLEAAAVRHSDDMAANEFMAHEGSDGSRVGGRVTSAGYDWSSVGENVAHGYPTVEQVMEGWKNSEGHCKNMMNGAFTEFGAAVNDDYWTQVFAKPR